MSSQTETLGGRLFVFDAQVLSVEQKEPYDLIWVKNRLDFGSRRL
ncbi:MAG: hypothetical protein V7K48_00935 [Nostoc sp.]